ncbi:hypothetical protein PTI98_012908 [Pleurotus ostreatus]|nr:hypothetical protein PTI98_012908 [Pleurotus ostreatus]
MYNTFPEILPSLDIQEDFTDSLEPVCYIFPIFYVPARQQRDEFPVKFVSVLIDQGPDQKALHRDLHAYELEEILGWMLVSMYNRTTLGQYCGDAAHSDRQVLLVVA